MSQFPPSGPYNSPNPGTPLPPGTVKNWLVESIIALCCGAGVLAIPAIIFAAQVNNKLAAGDYQGAVESANNAKKWLMISVGVALVCGCGSLCVFFGLLGAGAAAGN